MKLPAIWPVLLGVLACGDNTVVNRPPVAASPAIAIAIQEDGVAAFTVDALDPEGQALTYAVSAPAHGVLAGAGPSFTYTPARNYAGAESLAVEISDGENTATMMVMITIAEVGDAPVAVADTFADSEDTPLQIAAATLLANDTDEDSPDLTVTAVAGGDHGTVQLAGAQLTFTPDADFIGAAHFTYTISDGVLTSSATVTVDVGGVNDAPVAGDDAIATTEDTAVITDAATLIANDADPEGQSLTVSAATDGTAGVVTIAGSMITYTPGANFNGADSFTYTITDGAATDTATVTVTVAAVNDAPTAGADAISTSEDQPVVTPLQAFVANDADVDSTATIVSVANGSHGTTSLAGGAITYTPAANYVGPDAFTYTLSDGALSATGTVSVTVAGINDVPVAAADAISTDEDTAVGTAIAALLANDTDIDGTPTFVSATDGSHGAVAVAGGILTYTPAANYAGPDAFTYTITDGTDTATATVVVTVAAVNDAPVAVADAISTDEDTAVVTATSTLLANDSDLESTPSVASVTQGSHGTVALAGGSVTYTPTPDYAGPDAYTYTITDGALMATATVSVTVGAVDDAPRAVADAISTDEDTAVVTATSALLANDSDVESTPVFTSATDGSHGTVAVAGGNLTYTPAANYAGADSFSYTITAGAQTATATVSVTIAATNDAPVAVDDAISTDEDTAVVTAAAALLANDSDIEGTPSVASVTQGSHGAVTFAGGSVTYTPAADYAGADAFTYTITDGDLTAIGTVSVTVAAVDDAPVAVADAISTDEDTAVVTATSALLANDSDVEGTPSFVSASQGSHGAVAVAGGNLTYTPAANYVGADSFTYTITEGGQTAMATVSVTIAAVNDAPVAVADAISTDEDTAIVVDEADLIANDADVESALSIASVTQPSHGTVGLASGAVTYTPAANYFGADSFTYTVTDGELTAIGTVSVTVTGVIDAPIAVDDAVSTTRDTALVIDQATLIANDIDPDSNLGIELVFSGAHGSVSLAGGMVTYTPAAGYTGADSFTYQVTDGQNNDQGTVSVTVTMPPSDPPVVTSFGFNAGSGVATLVTLQGTDPDNALAELTFVVDEAPAHGTLTGTGVNRSYTADVGYVGPDQFTYVADDGYSSSAPATVTITVTTWGDGVLELGEECDDGNVANEDGCSKTSTIEVCGDALVQFGLGETCDDGNLVAGDGCDATCLIEPFVTTTPVNISGALSCSTGTANAARKVVADTSGNIYAVLQCGIESYVTTSTDRGLTFSAPVLMSDPAAVISQVAVGAGPFGVSYVVNMYNTGTVTLRVTGDRGATWSAEEVIGTSVSTSSGLSISAFNDDVYIGFSGNGGVQVLSNSTRGAGEFETVLVGMSIAFFDLLYDVRDGTVVVAADTPGFHIRASIDGGVTFAGEVNPPGQEYYSDWAIGNGSIYVVGTNLGASGDADRIYVIPTDNLSTSTAVLGLPTTSVAQSRTVAADAEGNAYVATQLDAGGLQLDRLLIGQTTLEAPRSVAATGTSPVVIGLPGSSAAAVVYTEGASVYATIQAY